MPISMTKQEEREARGVYQLIESVSRDLAGLLESEQRKLEPWTDDLEVAHARLVNWLAEHDWVKS